MYKKNDNVYIYCHPTKITMSIFIVTIYNWMGPKTAGFCSLVSGFYQDSETPEGMFPNDILNWKIRYIFHKFL